MFAPVLVETRRRIPRGQGAGLSDPARATRSRDLSQARQEQGCVAGSAVAAADLLPVYIDVLRRLAAEGAEWVQLDEPCLVLDLDVAARDALRQAYAVLSDALPQLKIMLTSYFGELGDNLNTAMSLPVAGVHIDLVRSPSQLEDVLKKAPNGLVLSLGMVDGRNIWRSNLPRLLDRLEPVVARRGADQIQSRRPVHCCMFPSISNSKPISPPI